MKESCGDRMSGAVVVDSNGEEVLDPVSLNSIPLRRDVVVRGFHYDARTLAQMVRHNIWESPRNMQPIPVDDMISAVARSGAETLEEIAQLGVLLLSRIEVVAAARARRLRNVRERLSRRVIVAERVRLVAAVLTVILLCLAAGQRPETENSIRQILQRLGAYGAGTALLTVLLSSIYSRVVQFQSVGVS